MDSIVAILTAISVMSALGLILGFSLVLILKTPAPQKIISNRRISSLTTKLGAHYI